MARMQKKKPAEKKKKSRQTGSPEARETGAEAGGLAEAPAGGSAGIEAKQKKQKTGSSGTRRPAAEQTAVVRFVERYFGTWIQFLREVKVELSKVTWPSRKETVGTTAVVLVFVFILAIFLGAADFILTSLVQLIL